MCQVEIKGTPKLTIGCNTEVREGMEVLTHHTSKLVENAQKATLEFILINHPLDCTVCDQSGHCKLQDYHYEFNGEPSRFLEEKEHKVKAQPLGPTVVLDGERCIMCTRCVRFCDEITQTSELGMLNRGDKSVIAVAPGRNLDNPLSGTVVDLCPVGALTHREWRFNTRIWFTSQEDSICTGCSTGCNVRVAERDGVVVQVKARANDAVNKEWLCDEGRYGFHRFIPESRLTVCEKDGKSIERKRAYDECFLALRESSGPLAVLISPDLLLEDYFALSHLLNALPSPYIIALAYRERNLSKVESILISPDYAANYRGAIFAGLVEGRLEARYQEVLDGIINGRFASVVAFGDRALPCREDLGDAVHLIPRLEDGLRATEQSVGWFTDNNHPLKRSVRTVVPIRSILECSGLLINKMNRLQYTKAILKAPKGVLPFWQQISAMGSANGCPVLGGHLNEYSSERDATNILLLNDPRLTGLTIRSISAGGVLLSRNESKDQG
jgi:NADH-quinone oxidoreductase subunit G